MPPYFSTPPPSVGSFTDLESPASSDHSYIASVADSGKCETCVDKKNLIQSYVKQVELLTQEVTYLKKLNKREKLLCKDSPLSWRKIKSDKKMNFYTGLSSILLFKALFVLLQP